MEKETIEAILQGNKTEINIKGHIYDVDVQRNIVTLRSETGDDASSEIGYDDYAYTHGGRVFQAAVEAAKEIRNHMVQKRAYESEA